MPTIQTTRAPNSILPTVYMSLIANKQANKTCPITISFSLDITISKSDKQKTLHVFADSNFIFNRWNYPALTSSMWSSGNVHRNAKLSHFSKQVWTETWKSAVRVDLRTLEGGQSICLSGWVVINQIIYSAAGTQWGTAVCSQRVIIWKVNSFVGYLLAGVSCY